MMNPVIARLAGLSLLGWACTVAAQPGGVASGPPAIVQPAGSLSVLRYTAPVPASWQPQTPASSFRAAQYRVPAAAGAADGELVVFYFGRGQGGSAAANAERWSSQFTGADGKPVAPRVATLNVQGMTATVVELNGSYARGVGMGPIGASRPDQTLLAAVIETPEGNVIIQLHGDRATVAQNRAGFEVMVKAFRVAG